MYHNLSVPFKVTDDSCFTQSDLMNCHILLLHKVRLLITEEYLLHSHVHRPPHAHNVRVK